MSLLGKPPEIPPIGPSPDPPSFRRVTDDLSCHSSKQTSRDSQEEFRGEAAMLQHVEACSV